MSGEGNTSSQSVNALLGELYEFCRSESLSEDALLEIIERHGCAPNNNDPDIRYEFFHEACYNVRVTEGILRILLKYFPTAARFVYEDGGELPLHYRGNMPLHTISINRNVTLGMVQLLIDAFPDSVSHENREGWIPFHTLCYHRNVDEEAGLEILKLLLKKCPDSVQRADEYGFLPIHLAALYQSLEFCRILVDAYPGSVRRMPDNDGGLPFHLACLDVAKVKYLYQLYPDSINVADNNGYYPIHYAIKGLKYRKRSAAAMEAVQFLLDCDPNVPLQELDNKLPLYYVCRWATNGNTPNLNAYLKILQILYDAHPEAIESNEVTSNVTNFRPEVRAFLTGQLSYARQARDQALMTTRDENGQLPLHRALHNNVTLGSIKLLVNGNPSAICTFDIRGMIPLHLACQHHETPAVVEYLINLDEVTLTDSDREGNTALHHACRGANHAIIELLLDKYGSMSVSKRNALNQLPIRLLLESNDVSGDDIKYVESVYRLMRAHPETIMNSI